MKPFYKRAVEYLIYDEAVTTVYRMTSIAVKADYSKQCLLVFAGILKSAARKDFISGLAPFCNRAFDGSSPYGTRLYPFEKAMRSADWSFAFHELWGVVRFLPINHPMVYNTLCRVFNESLGANLPVKGTFYLWKEYISDTEAGWFINEMKDAVKSIRLQSKTDEEKDAAADYVIEVVKEAYRANFHERKMMMLWQKENRDPEVSFFPKRYIVNGVYHYTEYRDYDGAPLNVNQCCITSDIHDRSKVMPAYLDVLKHGFHQEKGFYTSTYYPEAGIIDITNGYHYAAMASLLRTGIITPTKECRLSQFFPYVKTDGAYWIDIASGKRMCRASDYRAATIYELLRMNHNELHTTNRMI